MQQKTLLWNGMHSRAAFFVALLLFVRQAGHGVLFFLVNLLK